MSNKAEKKLRQMFRHSIKDKLDDMTEEWFGEVSVFKDKPKWCPQWLWSKLIAFIVVDSFIVKYEIEKAKREQRKAEKDADAHSSGN